MEEDEIRLRPLYIFEEDKGMVINEFAEVNEGRAAYGEKKLRKEGSGHVDGRLRKINDLMNIQKLEFAGLLNIYREEGL